MPLPPACRHRVVLYESIEALRRTAEEHTKSLRQDGENIRALARIAEIRERRPSRLEGTDEG